MKKRAPVLKIKSAEYVKAHALALHFNDGTKRVVDFAPFLNASKNPLIRQYLEPDNFKQFKLTNGDLQWNDYDLCFPIIDLYNDDLLHSADGKKKVTSRQVVRKNITLKAKAKRRVTKPRLQKTSGA